LPSHSKKSRDFDTKKIQLYIIKYDIQSRGGLISIGNTLYAEVRASLIDLIDCKIKYFEEFSKNLSFQKKVEKIEKVKTINEEVKKN
jgi:DNA replication initiation complex subunit (GINS family)